MVNEGTISMIDSNYLIINREPQKFTSIKIAGKTAVFLNEDGAPLNYGVIPLDESVYAVLCCGEVNNITLVTDRMGVRNVVTILWKSGDEYREGFARLQSVMKRHFHIQNKRINRYAEAIRDKLALGVRLRVTDAVDESKMAVCPECGTLNPPGSRYCLDCGADIR